MEPSRREHVKEDIGDEREGAVPAYRTAELPGLTCGGTSADSNAAVAENVAKELVQALSNCGVAPLREAPEKLKSGALHLA
jgi:hypothetical protein